MALVTSLSIVNFTLREGLIRLSPGEPLFNLVHCSGIMGGALLLWEPIVHCFCVVKCCLLSSRNQTSQSDSAFEDSGRDSNDSPDTQSEASPTRQVPATKGAPQQNNRTVPRIKAPIKKQPSERCLCNFCTLH